MLIQKDVKLRHFPLITQERLRALLIQKDVKLHLFLCHYNQCLRALLIQKDVKRTGGFEPPHTV